MNLSKQPHRRYNPLVGEWVLVSPQRTNRPWQGKTDNPAGFENKTYESNCYLCPGNVRSNGKQNPEYTGTFSFINDFSALLPDLADVPETENPEGTGFFMTERERGICKVICYSPRHDLTMALMTTEQIIKVVELWKQEYRELAKNDFINYIQIFENRGSIMGCSNMHPHGQIWCNEHIPVIPEKEDNQQKKYFKEKKSVLLLDYVGEELKSAERIIHRNDSFAALIPWWAVWPYELIVLPLNHRPSLNDLSEKEHTDLASVLGIIGIKYDNLFKTSFPYSMGIHQAPVHAADTSHWQMHLHYFPPLLRSASIQKFMVGYELLATPQRDFTAEYAADILRQQAEIHFYTKSGEKRVNE